MQLFKRLAIATQILLVACSASNAEDRAIVIGIGAYQNAAISPLAGDADAQCMYRLLVDHYGFSSAQIELLVSGQGENEPVHARIVKVMQDAVSKSQRGDRVFLYFAGHGSQVRDQANGDEAADDDCDEALCPADYDPQTGKNAIRDDDVDFWLAKLQGRSVTLFFDCCHSGTMARVINQKETRFTPEFQAGVKSRYITPGVSCIPKPPPATAPSNPNVQQPRKRFISAQSATSYICLSACKDTQVAVELPVAIGGGLSRRGAFTWHFIQQLTRTDRDRGKASCQDLLNDTVTALALRQLGAQTPELRASASASSSQPFLGGARKVFAAAPTRLAPGKVVTIDKGAVNGIHVGDRFVAGDANDGKAATLEVVRVREFDSECTLVSGDNHQLTLGRPLLRDLNLVMEPLMGLRLTAGVGTETFEKLLRQALATEPIASRITLSDNQPTILEVRFLKRDNGILATVHGLFGDVRWESKFDTHPLALRGILGRLHYEHDLRWLGRLPPSATPAVTLAEANGRGTFVIRDTVERSDIVRLRVTPARDCYLTVISVDSQGEIDVLYPNETSPADGRVKANKTVLIMDPACEVQIIPSLPQGHAFFRAITSNRPLAMHATRINPAAVAVPPGAAAKPAVRQQPGPQVGILPRNAGIRIDLRANEITIADLHVETVTEP